MKPHIPLILLSALLATAPVKAHLDYMATIPGHPAFIPDYEYFIVENNPSPIVPYVSKVARFEYNRTRSIPIQNYLAMGFFKKDDNDLTLGPLSLTSLAGSIILRQVVLSGTSLTTKADGIEDAVWGLPQVAIDGVSFSSGNINITSNYCTIRNWSCSGEEPLNFLLGNTGASFERGTATGDVSITSLTDVKINTLAITNGGLSIHGNSPIAIVGPKDWLVELCNIEVSGGVTVDVASIAKNSVKIDNLTITNGALSIHCSQYFQQYAPNDGLVELNDISASGGVTVDELSNYGRINVNNLTTGSSNVASSLLAREINLYGEINCDQLNIQASRSVALDGCVLSCNQLTISSIDANKPDITCNGSINVQGTATLTGRNIYGTFVKADLSANELKITADECVDYTGALRGNKQTITAKNVKLSGDVSGNTIGISASEEVALSGNMKVEKYLGVSAPDIELQGSIIGQGHQPVMTWVYLKGDNIRKTKVEGDFIAGRCDLEASREVNIQGTIQVGALVVKADKAITLDTVVGQEETNKSAELIGGSAATISVKSFLGDDLTVTSGGSIMLAAIGSLENPVSKAVITGQSDKPVAVESFIGDTLTVTAGGEIILESVGSLEKPVDSVTITSTSIAPVTVQSFHGGENGKLTIESRGIVTIGKQKEQGKSTPIPQYEGNIAINYLGSGATTKNDAGEEVETWAVAMEGKVVGSLTVNAVDGAVNAGHITGLGSVQAKRIDLASFEGSDLKLWASSSVNVIGNIQASGAVTIQQLPVPGPIVPDSVDINITTTKQIEAKEILLRGRNITCSSKSLSIFAENYLIDAVGKVTINGTMQGDDIIINAVGDITLGEVGGGRNNPVLNAQIESTEGAISLGTVNIASTEEKPSAITAATKVAIINNATLSHTNVTAPQVTVGNKLTLQDQSSIAGDVTASQDGTKIMVENSAITGKVSGMEGAAMTVNLTNATIGSAEKFSELVVKSASPSHITSNLTLMDGAKLSFTLDRLHAYTPALTIGGELMVDDPDNPTFTIDLAGTNLPVGSKYALITTTNQAQAPEFWGSANVSLTGLSSDEKTLFWEGGTLYFSLGGPELEVATWTGAASFIWNTEDVNWTQKGMSYQYKDGVAVVFDDTGVAGEVELKDELAPRSVLVENSKGHDYTFTGKGKLTGKTVLVKQGSGTLIVNTVNDYSGGTTINGGTLVMGNDKALGSVDADVKLGDATLDLAKHTLDNNVSVTGKNAYLGNGRLDGILSVGDGGKLTLLEHTTITEKITLGDGATLNLGGNTTVYSIIVLKGDATLGNGKLNSDVSVGDGKTLTLSDDLEGDTIITLGQGATLNLARNTLSTQVKLNGDATIGGGTLLNNLEVGEGKTLSLTGGDLLGTGAITLKDNAALAMGGNSTSKDITVIRNATVSNGSLRSMVTVQDGGTLFLGSHMHTDIGAALSLGEGSTADLGGNQLSLDVTLTGSAACIGNGTLDTAMNLLENKTLSLCGDLNGDNAISLGDGSALQLDGHTLAKAVSVDAGRAAIGGGTHNGSLNVAEGKTLALCGNLSGKNAISLANGSTLDLNKNILSKTVSLTGSSAFIGNGTLSVNLTVDAQKTLTLCGDLDGERAIILESLACLDLNSYTLSSKLSLTGISATIGGGVLDRDLFVGDRQKLTVKGELSGKGTLLLGSGSTLLHDDMVGGSLDNAIKVTGNGVTVSGNATIGVGSFCGHVSVESGMTLSLQSGTDIQSGITLEENTGLALGGATVGSAIMVSGNAGIGGGTLNSSELTVATGKTLTLNGNLEGSSTITLGHAATLQLNEKVLSNSVLLQGDATIGNGIVNGAVEVGENKTLALRSSLEGSGIISLGNGSALRLENATVGNKITGGASTTIVTPGGASKLTGDLSGFSGNVIVEMGSLNIMSADSVNVADATIGSGSSLGVYKGKAIPETPSLDSEGTLTVSGTLTAQDANSWLYANLVMKSDSVLDVSATGGNGGLHMGSTVTLDPGNVLLSEADMAAVNGLRYMQTYDLFSGVDGLSLNNGAHFLEVLGLSDPWVKASEVFANDLFKSAEREYYLFYSGKNQGGAVGYEGTVYLMRLPEPATGTLSLLALAALAARRRRK